jgi:hypothetical protein
MIGLAHLVYTPLSSPINVTGISVALLAFKRELVIVAIAVWLCNSPLEEERSRE